MIFDIESVPFSCYGANIAFSRINRGPQDFIGHLGLRSLYGLFQEQETYPIILLDKNENWMIPELEMTATEIIASSGCHEMRMCFHDHKTVHVIANTSLLIAKTELKGFLSDRIMRHENGICEIAGDDGSIRIRMHHGNYTDRSGWRSSGKTCEKIELLMEPDDSEVLDYSFWYDGITSDEPDHLSYEQDLLIRKKEYDEFCRDFQTSMGKYKEAMELAAYISWHSVVLPEGYIKYPVMLMSKNIMNMVWSWDYTFNALALVDKNPDLAYAQFLAMAAMQDDNGAYPDAFHARRAVKAFVKPPVQGFILSKMYKIAEPEPSTRKIIYRSVSDFTNWWLRYRTTTDGLPRYHHGNESGWDNGTVFKQGLPVKAPDLSTWLILQMDFLEAEAERMGLEDEQKHWSTNRNDLLQRLLKYLATETGFRALKVPEDSQIESESLLLYIPLLLGDRIPTELRETMLTDLLAPGRYFTKFGLASEPLDSSLFIEDGYWRGAVWPPTAYIFTELLRLNSRHKEAKANAAAYCDMCAREGFYENYSALDGHGLRDYGFTWSASAFMILIRDLLQSEENQ